MYDNNIIINHDGRRERIREAEWVKEKERKREVEKDETKSCITNSE